MKTVYIILALLLLYSIPVGGLLYTLIRKEARKNYVTLKTISSAAFLIVAVICAVLGNNLHLFCFMLPGFLLCFLGDVFMGVYNKNRNKPFFLMGVFTFLMGHICFVSAFCTLQPMAPRHFIFPAAAVIITIVVTSQRRMVLGKLKPYAYIYSFFVALLFSKTLFIAFEQPSIATLFLVCGAGLFLISDFLILYLYFYKHRAWSIHGWNLATYYYGVFLLAISLLFTF